MLRVYGEVLEVIRELKDAMAVIERRDVDLARQMRRAVASVALNVAEGQGSRGKNGALRFSTALGSMRETLACLDVAIAMGHLESMSVHTARKIDGICGSLYRLSH
jgi:four helix bundle protein